jgi:hypothetical protein
MGGLFEGLFGGGGGSDYPEVQPVTYVTQEAPEPTPVYQDMTTESAEAMAQTDETQDRLRKLYASGSESNKVSGAWKQNLPYKTTTTLGGG